MVVNTLLNGNKCIINIAKIIIFLKITKKLIKNDVELLLLR